MVYVTDTGRAWTLLGSRENSKPRGREMLAIGAARDAPQRPVHYPSDRAGRFVRRVAVSQTQV
jgi:hypothetical protein